MRELTGKTIVRNVGVNLASQLVPLLVAVVTVPLLLHSLGLERFGLLSLAWLALGYAGVFDLGVARATTRRVAAALASRRDEDIPSTATTSMAINIGLGVVAAILLGMATPTLVSTVFRIPADLASESEQAFIVVAWSLPVVLASTAARGMLEGAQRFDLVSLVAAPSSAATYLLPTLGAVAGIALPSLVLLLVLGRVAALIAYVALWSRAFPSVRLAAQPSAGVARTLVGYGGWLTLSSVASPVLVYGERAVITGTLGVGLLSLYVIPYDLVARIWVVPGSLAAALYPAFAVMSAGEKAAAAYRRSLLYLLFFLTPPMLLLLGAGSEILQVWLGREIARESVVPLQFFAAGALVMALAYVPLALLQGSGFASAAAKLHGGEILPAVALTWSLSANFGLIGAVVAWLCRVVFDAVALFILAYLKAPYVARQQLGRPLGAFAMAALSMVVAAQLSAFIPDLVDRLVLLVIVAVALVAGFWFLILSKHERSRLTSLAFTSRRA